MAAQADHQRGVAGRQPFQGRAQHAEGVFCWVQYNLGTDGDEGRSALTPGGSPAAVQVEVLDLLQRTPGHAELVSRLVGSMRRRNVEPEQVEQALADLQSAPAILVREHYCADPHLDNADLRVAAIIESGHGPHRDPIADAAERIESVWQRWLNQYLSNHTCV